VPDEPSNPPAGWYADPSGSGDLRWWDGGAWTPHTHADPAAPVTPATPAPPSQPVAPSQSVPPATPASDVPWWAQSGEDGPPSWWEDGTGGGASSWDASQAVGDRRGPADPSGFGVPGAVPESGAAPMAAPYANTHMPRPVARADGAVRALVLGIVALICCGIILGPIAIYEGVQVRYRVRVSNGRLSGDGMAVAAIVCGAVAFVLSLIGLWLAATGRSPFVTTNTDGR
jgi:hypothetical protein